MMHLKIVLPTSVLLETQVQKVNAEGPQGGFCLLPRHIDFVSSLVPGLFSFETFDPQHPDRAGEERFLALEQGMLVKYESDVLVATSNAVQGELGAMERAVQEMLESQSEQERRAQTSVARMEADFVKRFVGFGHGS